ncbi:ABC transporter ATP-binding protein [Anaerocolumna sp. AGMB13025]|uniref:ABC transporter ATP-binding protein n=1 Tax=Anaerocolumna sp. AGMB13025 TaxID=3039116 RepID=UPI00241EA676|nr:ABC transporter ATP-binding protein [Anaerocolumna sp. AGMB13025]WFR57090.1 ABC transporter ATP-binding protein [Anaerocolumna sp. AGMB13025]
MLSFLGIALLIGVIRFYSGWYELLSRPVECSKIERNFSKLIFEKINSMDLKQMENPKHYEEYQKVMNTAQSKIINFLDNLSGLFGKLLMCLLVISVLWTIDKPGLLILVLPVSTTWFIGKKYNKEKYDADMEKLQGTIRKEYVKRCFYSKKYSYEIRMTGISNALRKLYDEGITIINNVNIKSGKKRVKLSSLFELCKNRIPFSLILAYGVYKVMITKTMGVSDISVLLIGLVNLSDKISELANSYVTLDESKRYIYDIDLYLKKYSNEKEEFGEQVINDFKNTIEFNNVQFSYGKENQFQFKDLNLIIHKGEKIAIVGQNGAGKTTLASLLLQLYRPDSGKILIDNNDISLYNIEEYRKLFTVVEQNSKLFAMSIAENIICRSTNQKYDTEVKKSLEFSGLLTKIEKYKNGINSILTKEFSEEGVNFSKGELQKISIARAYAKKASIAIFDEPTSALDPLSEEDMLNKLLELSSDMTTIFIMHRMSFAKKVDRILLLEDGKIVEQGNHEEL